MENTDLLGENEPVDLYTLEEPVAAATGDDQLSEGERATGEPKKINTRRWVGLALGVVAALAVYFLLPGLTPETLPEGVAPGSGEADAAMALRHSAKVTAAVAVLMGIWWMTEAIPIPATALLPLVLFPLFSKVVTEETDEQGVVEYVIGNVPIKDVGAAYGNDIIFLFMGGFILALAMQRWNLHRRIALLTLKIMGPKSGAMIGGFMIATGFLSMWVSNTATAVMMLPIGMSVLLLVSRVAPDVGEKVVNENGETIIKSNFATALMLGIAYSASVGSLGTIIGTPPNTLLVGIMKDDYDINIGFGQWMLVGVPLSIVFMFATWFLLTKVLFKPEIKEVPGGRDLINEELKMLGKPSSGEIRVLLIFILAAVMWIFIPLVFDPVPITDAGIAMLIAVLLFIIPGGGKAQPGVRLMDWQTAVQMPWGVLLLFGGGLALSGQFASSGLTEWIGEAAQGSLSDVAPIILVIVVATAIIFLTELTSNTATAATFIPVAGGVALGIGMDPMLLAIPVALAATSAFMLPVATPPNAVAFGSGYVSIGQMVKGGVWLNLIGIILITAVTMTLAVTVFGIVY